MAVRIIHGDCRKVLPLLGDVDAVITDPVWPNCPPGLLEGSERPLELFAEAMAVLPASVKRLVVILRSDSDPRFLTAVPAKWRFICFPVSKTGYRGVRPNARRWYATIGINGTEQYLGSFGTPEEAARAYDAAALQHYGEFANLNFPQGLSA